MGKRECGDCTMCCKLLGVPEFEKPAGTWCTQCKIGSGCRIYADRPPSCRAFECLWAQGEVPEDLKPDKVRVVFATAGKRLLAHVDPSRPGAYRDGAVNRFIDRALSGGLEVIVACGDRRAMLTTRSQ